MKKYILHFTALLVLAQLAPPALAQTSVPTYTEAATGSVKQGIGVSVLSGGVASGAADSGNPVKVGCVYNATLPTYADGQRTDCQTNSRGDLRVVLSDTATGVVTAVNPTADGFSSSTSLSARSLNVIFNGTTWDRMRGDTNGLWVNTSASSNAGASITPVVGSLVNAVVGKASAGNLYGVEITTAATAGYLYVFNATAAPADGAVTAGTGSGNYQYCQYVPATSTTLRDFDIPDRFSVGITAVFSSSACGTLTKNATAVFLKARTQ